MEATKEMLEIYIRSLTSAAGYFWGNELLTGGSKRVRADLEELERKKDTEIADYIKKIEDDFQSQKEKLNRILPFIEEYERVQKEEINKYRASKE